MAIGDETTEPTEATPVTTVSTTDEARETGPSWSRKYPPLVTILVGLVIAIFVLPSSLNLPQTNPTQTLEYAPLPPDDQNNAPPSGNLSALGLGASSGLQGEGAAGGPGGGGGLPPDEGGQGRDPASTYRCVYIDGVQRQTEDPLSPPCVSFFKGNNFGATYQGVTGNEVKILIYMDPVNDISASDSSNTSTPSGAYYDVNKSCDSYDSAADKDGCNHLQTQAFKVWQRYFNDRFQTYGRKVHFIVYYSDIVAKPSPDERQAEAAENYQLVKPFAVVSFAFERYEDTYLRAMASRGVLNFGSFGGRTQSFFNEHPKLIWGYLPSVEQQADGYASYVCQKMVNQPAVFSGNVGDNGTKRKFGIIHSGDEGQVGFRALAAAIKNRVNQCGGNIGNEEGATNGKRGCNFQDNENAGASYAQVTMGQFQRDKVTTVMYTGCTDPNWLRSAQAIGYSPEWVLLGDGELDASFPIDQMGGASLLDKHAINITPQTYKPPIEQQRCYQAFREAGPDYNEGDLHYVCDYYENLFQLFVGIQVAGPRLGPTSIDQGFHAIPQRTSGNPQVPACFYNAGDYTCVKDAEAMWFDKNASPPGSSRPGCWHSIQGGARSLPGKWPSGNAGTDWSGSSDPCNGYTASAGFIPA
ncbi:MAG: hypothetical protein QOG03_2475 [Actinomycetota bacterium]|jgi:hypothetical protein|nr:hypothetical protein [Actinomycetota bacterium]